MTGVITNIKIKTDAQRGGFGFIKDEEGQDRFFHARDIIDANGESATYRFNELPLGVNVTFEPTAHNGSKTGKGNGLRAIKVVVP